MGPLITSLGGVDRSERCSYIAISVGQVVERKSELKPDCSLLHKQTWLSSGRKLPSVERNARADLLLKARLRQDGGAGSVYLMSIDENG